MTILFIGDSITEGKPGVSYIELLKSEYPKLEIINAGIGGDTLKNIGDRLITELRKNADYDRVVIEAGYNDVILPTFGQRSFLFRYALEHLLKVGRAPLPDPETFEAEYLKILNDAQGLTNAKFILTTIGCVNERLSADTNRIRQSLNQKIRATALAKNCGLADVAKDFETVLAETSQTDFLLNSFINSAYLDQKFYAGNILADKLSVKRKLQLTTDGVHLNTKGAIIFKDVIVKQLLTDAVK